MSDGQSDARIEMEAGGWQIGGARKSLPPVTGSALNREQREILYHTEHRAAGGYYCGGGKDMDALVAAGLMEYAGRKSFVPDPYYKITSKGRAALRAQNAEISHE